MQLCCFLSNNSSPQRAELALLQNIGCSEVSYAVCYVWAAQAWAVVPQKAAGSAWPVLSPCWEERKGRLNIVPGPFVALLCDCGMRDPGLDLPAVGGRLCAGQVCAQTWVMQTVSHILATCLLLLLIQEQVFGIWKINHLKGRETVIWWDF